MVRWTRDRLLIAVCLVLLVGAIGGWWAHLIPPEERGNALILPGFVLTLVGVLIALMSLGEQLGRRVTARSVEVLADRLAEAVDGQWRKEAHERRLLPDPIPLRWSLSDLAVAGSVSAAVGAPGAPPAFRPLPGYVPIAETDLHAGGGRNELHTLYAGLASGRIVVVGAPGAGKSGTAILLLLDTLTHRSTLDDTQQRARVPVPVLLTTHGWDPTRTSVQDWLADQLAATYPMFAHRGGHAEAVALIAARDKVALLLDGLDEIDAGLRPTALQALSDAPFRVVVLTRSQEMLQAISTAWLAGAVTVHLHDVTAAEAGDYLQRALTGPPPCGWAQLLTHLRGHPEGAPARGLSTPLTLTLLRDTYHPDDDVRDLIQLARTGPPAAVEQHLIARVLSAAYTPQPGRPAPRYTEQQARQTLSFIAQQMGTNRDLAWWHVPRWISLLPRVLVTGLVCGLLGGLGDSFSGRFWTWTGFALGLYIGVLGGLSHGLGSTPVRVRLANWRMVLSHRVLSASLMHGLRFGLWAGLILGLVSGLSFVFTGEDPSPGVELLVLGFGFMFGFVVVFVFCFVGKLAVALGDVLFEGSTGAGNSLGPYESWRKDQMASLLIGLGSGLAIGLMGVLIFVPFGLGFELVAVSAGEPMIGGFWAELWVVLGEGLLGVLVVVLGLGLSFSKAWAVTLAWLQLRWSGHVSAVGFMPFLEDARKHGVLRTVGAVYQFRHGALQDQLVAATLAPVNK